MQSNDCKSNRFTSNGPWEPSLETRKSCRKIVDEVIRINFVGLIDFYQ